MSTPLANIYARLPVAFTHDQGARLWDQQGRKYLDTLAGIGVSCLGHGYPKLAAAIAKQAARLIHTLNIYEIPRQTEPASGALQAGLLTNATRERVIRRLPR